MWKAIVSKELRETFWIAGLGLAAYLYAVASNAGLQLLPPARTYRVWSLPFVSDSFLENFTVISLALTITLGLRQTLSESVRGTWLFLLHRPVERRTLIGIKLAVGAGLDLLCAAPPILIYAWWAATPGTHGSPFYWSMTLGAWWAWFSLLAFYFAAFLSGLRPGRWFGSRLFPLAGTGALFFLHLIPQPGPLHVATAAALPVALLLCIFHVARTRDFS
jgi:hypothetical protein